MTPVTTAEHTSNLQIFSQSVILFLAKKAKNAQAFNPVPHLSRMPFRMPDETDENRHPRRAEGVGTPDKKVL